MTQDEKYLSGYQMVLCSCAEAYFKEVARFRLCPGEGKYGIYRKH